MRISQLLRYPKKKKGVSAIYFTATNRNGRAIIYPGESIDVANWINNSEKRIHKPKPIPENNALIGRLNRIEQLIRDTNDELQKNTNSIVSHKELEKAVYEKLKPSIVKEKNEPVLITEFFNTLIHDSTNGFRKTKDDMDFNLNSIKPYVSTLNHFTAFQKQKKRHYFLTDIDQTLIDDFTNYLNDCLALNTSAKYLTTLKTLISYAIEKKLISINVSLENKVKVRKAKADDIYLTEQEIQAIMDIKMFPTKLFETVRDLFIVGCNTGLRFSDYSILKIENIKDGFLEIDPGKMHKKYSINTKVVIPVFPMFQEILKKYPDGFPKCPCNQIFNRYLKEIGERIPSLNQDYEKKIIRKHKVERIKLKKWAMLVTHTARRSFCTNMYLRGIPTTTIMAISGHTTEENFKKYIKADSRKHAELLKQKIEEELK